MVEDRCDLLCLDLPTAERLRLQRLDARAAELAAGRAHALADPTRLTLAAALLEAEGLCVCDLAWIVERAQNLVSHHGARCGRMAWCVRGGRGRWCCTRSPTTAGCWSRRCSRPPPSWPHMSVSKPCGLWSVA